MYLAGEELLHRLEGTNGSDLQAQTPHEVREERASISDQIEGGEREGAAPQKIAAEGSTAGGWAGVVDALPAATRDKSTNESSAVLAALLEEQRSVRQEVAALARSLQRVEALLGASVAQAAPSSEALPIAEAPITALTSTHESTTKGMGDITA